MARTKSVKGAASQAAPSEQPDNSAATAAAAPPAGPEVAAPAADAVNVRPEQSAGAEDGGDASGAAADNSAGDNPSEPTAATASDADFAGAGELGAEPGDVETPANVGQLPSGEVSVVASASEPAADDAAPAVVNDQKHEAGVGELSFPLRVRVINNSRMPVQVPAAALEVGPSPASATTTVASEAALESLCNELAVLASLNGLGPDAFAVEPDNEDDE